jgi:hypothetical protein
MVIMMLLRVFQGGNFPTIESLIEAVKLRLDVQLMPIFHKFSESN